MPHAHLLRRIADAIEAEPVAYDQTTYGPAYCLTPPDILADTEPRPSCETPACIAGWAIALNDEQAFAAPDPLASAEDAFRFRAADALHLDTYQAEELFAAHWNAARLAERFNLEPDDLPFPNFPLCYPSAKQAAATLRAIADRAE